MRRDKDVKAYTNRPGVFVRDATAATKRPARFVAKKTRRRHRRSDTFVRRRPSPAALYHRRPRARRLSALEFYAFSQAAARMRDERRRAVMRLQLPAFCRTFSCIFSRAPLPSRQRRFSAWGPGDTELGLKYRFVEQDKTNATPSIAFYPLLEAPTGDPNARTRRRPDPRPAAVLGQKDFGDWSTFGGGGYWINPGPGAKNNWFVGWVLQRKVAEHWRSASNYSHQTPTESTVFR